MIFTVLTLTLSAGGKAEDTMMESDSEKMEKDTMQTDTMEKDTMVKDDSMTMGRLVDFTSLLLPGQLGTFL